MTLKKKFAGYKLAKKENNRIVGYLGNDGQLVDSANAHVFTEVEANQIDGYTMICSFSYVDTK